MNPPTSFKTNVNRAKTKRWVEAKSYSYDGDDWGDAGDYDEYNGYDEVTPPARPTGFRQPGQAVDSPSYINQGARADSEGGRDYRRRDYGDLSAHSTGARTQDGGRSATNPSAPSTFTRERVNSFDRNDEKRAFSAGGMPGSYGTGYASSDPTAMMQGDRAEHQHSARFPQMRPGVPSGGMSNMDNQWHQSARQGSSIAAPLQVQTHFPTDSDQPATDHVISPVTVSQTPTHPEPPRQRNTGSRTHSMTSNTPSMDLQHRRDLSPSALPPPLHPRASPAPKSANDDSPVLNFPPRKSSLSQQSSPYTPNLIANTQDSGFSHEGLSSPGVAQAEGVSSFKDRAGSNAAKPLPFVRPADIYKRMEEEREKARRSQDFGRPSMDSLIHRPAGETSGSATELAKDVSPSDNQSKRIPGSLNIESTDINDINRRPKPVLDPVAERRSEYGFKGFHEDVQPLTTEDSSALSAPPEALAGDRVIQPNTIPKSQDRPVLPSVLRVSGFGDDFMKDSTYLGDGLTPDRNVSNSASGALASAHLSPDGHGETEQSLQHQPSLGFRSVVHQAFDRPEDRSVPPTPSSTGGSGVARSNSESTTGVSPIMSRVPSAATTEAKARASGARDIAAPSILEEVSETSLTPTSSQVFGNAKQLAQTPPPLHPAQRDSAETPPQVFKPGHRRDLSTPSPGNSPARSPAVEAIHGLPSAEQVEMASATPIDGKHVGSVHWSRGTDTNRGSRIDYTTREADAASSDIASSIKGTSNVANIISEAQSSFWESRRNNTSGIQSQSRPESPIARNESPTKGKVRNLADRFEAEGSSRRGSAISSPTKASSSSNIVRNGADLTPPRPLTDRMASFRPKLPGAWESYATTREVPTPGREPTGSGEGLKKSISKIEDIDEPVVSATTSSRTQDSDQHLENEDVDITPTTVKRTLSIAQVEPPMNPFTAAAAAGSALAGAIAAAAGLEYNESRSNTDSDAKEEPDHTANLEEFGAARGRHITVNTGVPPLQRSDTSLSKEGRGSVSTVSSTLPTPSPKDSSPVENERLQTSDNLSTMVPREQKIAEPAYTYDRPVRPQMLPSLSTESGPQDYESDRLRKEIVKSLSPRTSRVVSGNKSPTIIPDTDEHGSLTEPTSMGQFRESTVLPQEYESYWNGSSDEDEVLDQTPDDRGKSQSIVDHGASSGRHDHLASLPRKFSWEQDSQGGPAPEPPPMEYVHQQEDSQVSSDPPAVPAAPPARFGDLPSRSADEYDNITKALAGSPRGFAEADVNEQQDRTEEDFNTSKEVFDASPDREDTPIPAVVNTAFAQKASADSSGIESPDDDVPQYGGGLEVGRPSLEKDHSSGSDRPSFVNSGIGHYSSKPSNDRDGQPGVHDAPPSVLESGGTSRLSPSPVPAAQPKIATFREILNLKSPAERIKACNNAREQFSKMDTGLNHWIITTIDALPEHEDLLSAGGRFDPASIGHQPSPSRGKLLRTSPTSAANQQPYYQQYLNASSQPPASSSGLMLPTPSASGSQGFSPSGPGGGARMASQQVQAKGKDLLHSAGLLGGKANHAAKGFFSKGKSRFRGSGVGDKDVPRNAPEKLQPEPQLDAAPPPYFDRERGSRPTKSFSTGSRPLTVYDDPYRKRPFSTVLPQRPFSYAPHNDFELPPSTPPGREFRRLGVLPSPTVDATPMNHNNAKDATGDNVSQKAIGRDDSTVTIRDAVPLERLEPPTLGDNGTDHSSSRSAPIQDNPAMVGDVPVYLKTSASSQVSALSSEKADEETALEEEVEKPGQSESRGPIDRPGTFIPTRLEANESRRPSELLNQPFSSDVQSATSQISNGSLVNSSSVAEQQVGRTDKDLLPSTVNNVQTGVPPETEQLPPANHRQAGSPYNTDTEPTVSSPTALLAHSSRGSRNLSGTSNPGILRPEQPTETQVKRPQYPAERDVSPLPIVAGPVATGSTENTPFADNSDSNLNSHTSHPYDRSHSSANGAPPGGRIRSDSLKSRSPDVSPNRQNEAVNHESEMLQQNRTPRTNEREAQIQYRISSQGQSRPFSFAQYTADEPAVPSQDQVLREGQWESGYRNRQDPHLDGSSSFNIRPGWPSPRELPSQQQISKASRDERLRHSSSMPYRHHPSLSGSSYDPNILDHPAYRQGQPSVARDLPSNYYPAETRREEGILPRLQSTEYQLTGIGPPQTERIPQKRRSSSRSSAFFKGLSRRSSSRTDVPKMPSAGGRTTSDQPDGSNPLSKRVSKRISVFRSFTQRRGSDSGRSNDSFVAQPLWSRTDLLQQSVPITPQPLQNNHSSERNPKENQNKSLRQRLRRRSTPGVVEPEEGKKKRFSLRNLFARFGPTKRSASPVPAPPAQLSPPARSLQRPTLPSQQSSAYFAQSTQPYLPPPERSIPQNQDPALAPPLGGYYAPEIRIRPKSGFVGGRRLSEEQVGEAKYRFESQSGFHGPYHGSTPNSSTPDMQYHDPSVSAGPSVARYATPPATAERPGQYSNYDGSHGMPGTQQYPQSPSQYAHSPRHDQWSGQPAYTSSRPFDPPDHQVSPQVSRPDLHFQYTTPSPNYPPSKLPPQPTNATSSPRPYAHNFSLHHRVDSPRPSRDDSPQPHPHPRPGAGPSRPGSTPRTPAAPQLPPANAYPPPVPPKNDRFPFLPGPRTAASTPMSSANPNIISQLSARAGGASPRASGTGGYGSSGLKGVGPLQQQRGREQSGAGGLVAEMDANNGLQRRGQQQEEEEEEEIVMSSTAYPGQEWAPSNYGYWEDD